MADERETELHKRYKEVRARLWGPAPDKATLAQTAKPAVPTYTAPKREARARPFRTFKERVDYWRGKL